MGDDAMADLLRRAREAFDAMSPVDRAIHEAAQKRSFVRSMTGQDPGPDILAEEVKRLRVRVEALQSQLDTLRHAR